MVSNYSTKDRYRCFFNKQIILISEKDKCDIAFGLFLSVSFRFFKVTDMIVLLFFFSAIGL